MYSECTMFRQVSKRSYYHCASILIMTYVSLSPGASIQHIHEMAIFTCVGGAIIRDGAVIRLLMP